MHHKSIRLKIQLLDIVCLFFHDKKHIFLLKIRMKKLEYCDTISIYLNILGI